MGLYQKIRGQFLSIALIAHATTANADALAQLTDKIARTEADIGGRVGVAIKDSGTNWTWGYRADERFPMNSTFKSLLCGSVLYQVDKGTMSLDDTIPITTSDIESFAPATKDRVGEDMRIDELCYGTLDKSDNTAANLLITRLGGPEAVTQSWRSIGDPVSRLDRMEPDMNFFAPGDPRDTTTPAAMIATWETLLMGDALRPASQEQLADWMRDGWATGAMIRPHLPPDWSISDKSGGGRTGSRGIVAMITPPAEAPTFVAIYIAESNADWDARNAAIADLGAAVVDVLTAR